MVAPQVYESQFSAINSATDPEEAIRSAGKLRVPSPAKLEVAGGTAVCFCMEVRPLYPKAAKW